MHRLSHDAVICGGIYYLLHGVVHDMCLLDMGGVYRAGRLNRSDARCSPFGFTVSWRGTIVASPVGRASKYGAVGS